MQAAVQSGGPSPRALTRLISSSQQQLKGIGSVDSVQNVLYSLSGKKGKKRERADQNLDLSGGKREQNVKFDDHPNTSTLRREQSMKLDEIATILNKDGGLLNVGVVEHLVKPKKLGVPSYNKRLLETTFQLDISAAREYCEADDRWVEAMRFLDLDDGASWQLFRVGLHVIYEAQSSL
ncbi:unnamed protein product [Sphagnum balticum]